MWLLEKWKVTINRFERIEAELFSSGRFWFEPFGSITGKLCGYKSSDNSVGYYSLMMEAASTRETSVYFNQTIPKVRHLYTHCHETLNSHLFKLCVDSVRNLPPAGQCWLQHEERE
ncbi:uncharacterized protein LOC110838497 [Zootermopsis nevadensis]|uniref:uncharacterized protein LOC110838497 n=1 Tax=Zootermopsis nevadensis TaxID=136037 RepID=UPI000B8ED550|nr:uncharacterized protein LOC110838497 [Zootermopsis nevadensis]